MSSISSTKTLRVERNIIEITDPYATPGGTREVAKLVEITTKLADQYRESKGITTPLREIPRGRIADKSNWGLQYMINTIPALEEWLDTAARATTVDTLYNPDTAKLSSGRELDDRAKEFLKNCDDALGIRSRSMILSDLMSRDAVIDEKWLSLACGNAHPILEAAAYSQTSPRITLVDFNFDNLRHAKRIAKERGLQNLIDKRLFRDLTYKKGFRKSQPLRKTFAPFVLKQRPTFDIGSLKKGNYDRIEACGFFEYLNPESAARFIKRTFELLAPGGRFIFNNISDKHPQRDFTEGVIQWPFIKFRGVDEMVEIIRMSGVALENDQIEVFEASDNVCLMYELRKPR